MALAAQLVVALLAVATGFRVRKPRRNISAAGDARNSQPAVAGLWAFGSPGPASPGLVNTRGNNPCFPGLRMWTVGGWSFWRTADFAVTVTGAIGFRHAHVDGLEADVNKKSLLSVSCGSDSPNKPRGVPSIIHDVNDYYIPLALQKNEELLNNISAIALRKAPIDDAEEVRRRVREYGWELIGTAFDKGNTISGGPQSSHLIQNPQSRVCYLTFQGTQSTQDWIANLDIRPAHFCGLVDEDQSCFSPGHTPCRVRREGQSFVHQGFRDNLRRMIRNQEWQNEIRPRLSSCSEVHVAGHSLGGAMASLFTACIAKAPQPGVYGHDEDYKYMSWTSGR